jgi:hypothetical protein
MYWWKLPKNEREAAGLKGRVFMVSEGFTSANMCEQFVKSTETAFDNFKPRQRITFRNCYELEPKQTGHLV